MRKRQKINKSERETESWYSDIWKRVRRNWDVNEEFLMRIKVAMTINKSQRQSLKHFRVYLRTLIFSYDHLYVAIWRVTSRKCLKILITNENGEDDTFTSNVIFFCLLFLFLTDNKFNINNNINIFMNSKSRHNIKYYIRLNPCDTRV